MSNLVNDTICWPILRPTRYALCTQNFIKIGPAVSATNTATRGFYNILEEYMPNTI